MSALGTSEHFYTVFDNLIRNAREAVASAEHAGKRTITIRDELVNATYIVRIQDTGVGIPRENYDKIFEAFFSTKPAPGTGLGRGNVRKTLELYDATVEFDSVVDQGTTFAVSLPRAHLRTGQGQDTSNEGALAGRYMPFAYLPKGGDVKGLIEVISKAVDKHRQLRERRAMMQRVREQMRNLR